MWSRSILIVGWLSTLGFVAAALTPKSEEKMQIHLLVGLAATLWLLFAHVWILLYLLGTARATRRTVEEGGLPLSLVAESRRLIRRVLPWILAVAALVLAVFVVGGAVFTGSPLGWLHGVLAGLALLAQGAALWAEGRVLADHRRIVIAIESTLPSQS